MTIFFTILKIIGTILLVVIALILLVLFVPVRYRADASVDDPAPHDEFDPDYYAQHIEGLVTVTWLFHFVTATVRYPDRDILSVRVAGFKVLSGLPSGKKKEKKAQETEKEQEKKPSLTERVRNLYDRVLYYKKALTCKSGKRALNKVRIRVAGLLKKVLPREWEMTGRAGFGDPALSGIFLSVQGMLCPVTGGNLKLEADFQQWILDVHLHAAGSFRIVSILAAVLGLLFDRDVKKLIHRLRRGPSQKKAGKEAAEEAAGAAA